MQNQSLNKKAYSYIRFSTPEQSKGDSLRRQTKLAVDYALANGLQLQDISFKDLGISAWDGSNFEVGALSAFLAAVKDGFIPSDSYLLVESLDRISRLKARAAAAILGDICDLGISVVTLNDNKVYTKDSLDNDFAFIMAVLIFVRANEESNVKSDRLKFAWDKKRGEAVSSKKPMTKLIPAWLRVADGKIVKNDRRVRIIRFIFAKFLAGVGYASIASLLNEKGIKPWQHGKFWHRSYIKKILQNPTVIGHFTPHVMRRDGHKKTRIPLETIVDYFPAIIDEDVFYRVQAMFTTVLSKSTKQANIFAMLAKCPLCKSTLTRKSYGTHEKSGSPALICTNARAKAGCDFKPLKIEPLEHFFIKYITPILNHTPSTLFVEQQRYKELSALIYHIDMQLSNLSKALAINFSESLSNTVFELESEKKAMQKEREHIEFVMYESSADIIQRRRSDVINYFKNYDGNAAAANLYLKSMINAIYFDREYCEIVWKNGHSTFEHYVVYDNLINIDVDVETFW
ncbi:recombinase family protein [Methylomonas sp. CM2]|uniref:recombinase family protein n=1 Tax=Methylomonas sp. CM2 TaxID=3417647 RepID=UPI003CFAE99E